jgi:hypothetical protein
MGPEINCIRGQTHIHDLHRAGDQTHLAKMDVTQQDLKRLRGSRNTARAFAFMSMFGRLFPRTRHSRLRLGAVSAMQLVDDNEIVAAVRRHHNMDVSYVYTHLRVDVDGPSKAATSRRLEELVDEGVLRMQQDASGTRYTAAPTAP